MKTPMIIPVHHGSGSLSHEDVKILIGVWIVLNIIWIITTVCGFYPAFKWRKNLQKRNNEHNFSTPYNTNILKAWFDERKLNLIFVFDVVMIIVWGLISLFWLGYIVSGLF